MSLNVGKIIATQITLGLWCAVAKPGQLGSAFISIDNLHKGPSLWNASRWDTAFQDLADINISEVILANAITEHTAHYPSTIPGFTVASNDTVRDALNAAARHGAKLHLGVVLRHEWFKHGAMNATFLNELLNVSIAVAQELVSLYGHEPAFAGLYNTAEVYDTCCYGPCDESHARLLSDAFLEPFGAEVHSLRPGSPLRHTIAPFFHNVSAPSVVAAFWKTIFDHTPSLDVVAFQDGVGVQNMKSPEQAMEYLLPLSRLADSYQNIAFCTDVEIFVKHPVYRVADSARVLQQLSLEAPVTASRSCWEYSHYLDPRSEFFPEARQLYNDYKAWLNNHSADADVGENDRQNVI